MQLTEKLKTKQAGELKCKHAGNSGRL